MRQSRRRTQGSGLRPLDFPFCARCSAMLERHQPDSERPENILGTCADCGAWYLIDEAREKVYPLPDLSSFQKNGEG